MNKKAKVSIVIAVLVSAFLIMGLVIADQIISIEKDQKPDKEKNHR